MPFDTFQVARGSILISDGPKSNLAAGIFQIVQIKNGAEYHELVDFHPGYFNVRMRYNGLDSTTATTRTWWARVHRSEIGVLTRRPASFRTS